MLHRVTISNFESIRDAITLDFRTFGTSRDSEWLRSPVAHPTLQIPTVAALTGPSGAGKTTCLRAIQRTMAFAAHSYRNPPGTPLPFPAFAAGETRIEIELDVPSWEPGDTESRRALRYTLALTRKPGASLPHAVRHEALHHLSHTLMERGADHTVRTAKALSAEPGDVPAGASALSTLSAVNAGAHRVLAAAFARMAPINGTLLRHYQSHPATRDRILQRLRRLNLAAEDTDTPHEGLSLIHHDLDRTLLPSRGSCAVRHLVQILPAIDHALVNAGVAIVDDLDRHLDPALSLEILGWFRSADHAQMICTLHQPAILDHLGQEQILTIGTQSRSSPDRPRKAALDWWRDIDQWYRAWRALAHPGDLETPVLIAGIRCEHPADAVRAAVDATYGTTITGDEITIALAGNYPTVHLKARLHADARVERAEIVYLDDTLQQRILPESNRGEPGPLHWLATQCVLHRTSSRRMA